MALAERLGAEDVMVHALMDIGAALYYTQPERGLALIQESLRRALAANLPHAVCRGYAITGTTLHLLNHYAEARAAFQAFVTYAERFQMGDYACYSRAELFHLEWLQGDWSARQRHQPLLAEYLSIMHSIGTAYAGTFLAQAYNDLGQAAAARQVLELTLPEAQGAAETQTTLPHLGELTRADTELGREAEATASVTDIIEWVERVTLTHPNSIMALHYACQCAVKHRLIDLARRGLRQLERTLELHPLSETAACVSEARGYVALLDSDVQRATASLHEALDQWTKQERPYDQLRTLNGLSRALLISEDKAGVREACTQALKIVATLAAQLNDEEMKTSFLKSALVREIEERRRSV